MFEEHETMQIVTSKADDALEALNNYARTKNIHEFQLAFMRICDIHDHCNKRLIKLDEMIDKMADDYREVQERDPSSPMAKIMDAALSVVKDTKARGNESNG